MRVAIKVVRRELVRQPEFRARFRREAESAMRVPRFCTAEVLDADPDAPEPFLVTEYIDGPTLDEVVKNEGPLRRAELDQLGVSIAAALTGIHGTGVIHRDLKPANVLLSRLGPRVIDFGIASAVDATRLTAEGKTLGTPAYMAPEQVKGHPVAASDVFCWGSVMAFAATGRHPFGKGPLTEVAARIAHEPPDLEGLGGPLREAVEAAMRKDPAARPTPVQLLEMLGVSGNDPLQAVRTRLEPQDVRTRHDPGRIQPPAPTGGTGFRFGPGVPTGQSREPIPSQVADIWRSGRSPQARRHENRVRTALAVVVAVLVVVMLAWSLLR
jgi:serine/threonine protein kinase